MPYREVAEQGILERTCPSICPLGNKKALQGMFISEA